MPRQPNDPKPKNITAKNKLSRSLADVIKLNDYRVKVDPSAKPWPYVNAKGQREKHRASPQDKLWLLEVPCRRGRKVAGRRPHIYVHSSTHLGYSGIGSKIRRELMAVEGVVAWHTGDDEFSVIFLDRLLPRVAEIVRPYARRGAVSETESRKTTQISTPVPAV